MVQQCPPPSADPLPSASPLPPIPALDRSSTANALQAPPAPPGGDAGARSAALSASRSVWTRITVLTASLCTCLSTCSLYLHERLRAPSLPRGGLRLAGCGLPTPPGGRGGAAGGAGARPWPSREACCCANEGTASPSNRAVALVQAERAERRALLRRARRGVIGEACDRRAVPHRMGRARPRRMEGLRAGGAGSTPTLRGCRRRGWSLKIVPSLLFLSN